MNNRFKVLDYTQRVVDFFIVLCSWAIAYYLRFVVELGGDPAKESLADKYVIYGILLAIVSVIVFKNSNVYSSFRFQNINKEIFDQVKANFLAFVTFLVVTFFVSRFRLSRITLISYFSISSLLLVFSKIYFQSLFNKTPVRVILVGDGFSAREYFRKISKLPNYIVEYWIEPPAEIPASIKVEQEIDYSEIDNKKIDSVVLGYDLDKSTVLDNYLKVLSEHLIPIIVLPDLRYSKLGHSYRDFQGQTLLFINDPKAKPANLLLKRIFDFFATLIGVIVISPLLLLLALLVKLTSRGPIFYGQVRMGVDGREFKMWKFRSMVVGDKNKEGWTVKDDPRVTPVGKILRKTSLDELPQLWNVLKGDMSLVGPRPERPVYVEQFREEIPSYMLRHKFKAGITGWAQINGWRGDTSIEKRIECDLWYIKNWSFGLDIYILLMTLWKGFVNKNAY